MIIYPMKFILMIIQPHIDSSLAIANKLFSYDLQSIQETPIYYYLSEDCSENFFDSNNDYQYEYIKNFFRLYVPQLLWIKQSIFYFKENHKIASW